ncbi:AraC family transcriptional regulator [Chitinophaga rhizophila]|uniref:AraC family transcriptional regulator n=1 Tax=Chitinophaga rhizophila TaxID=2866212 RepID=A0ABS7G6C3_9BACT|nr:helix-turn-helix transcriptional regulator [Chitinophaga rhizophila]MBW8683194.1 AraC family transcriptional regulator [Chitinophaga rhizophila]
MIKTHPACIRQQPTKRHAAQTLIQEGRPPMPFEIYRLEDLSGNNQLKDGMPHVHNSFELIWVIAGSGNYFVDNEQHVVMPDQVYCLAPGQLHHFKPAIAATGYVITFSPEFLLMPEDNAAMIFHAHSFQSLSRTTIIQLTEEVQVEMRDLAGKMVREFDNYFLLRAEILRGLLNIFMIYLTRQYRPSEGPVVKSGNRALVNRFFSIVEQKYMEYKLVAEYAGELAVTPNHLNEMVKKVSGFPASHHIRQRVVLEAKRLATYSGSSMKEIAYSLGFDDIAHFSKFFKNFSGSSFTDYKKEAMQQFLSIYA